MFSVEGKGVTLSNIIDGATSEFFPPNTYYGKLVPGCALFIAALGAGIAAWKSKSLKGRVFFATSALGLLTYAVSNVGFFIWQSNCLGWHINTCKQEADCRYLERDPNGIVWAVGGKPPYVIKVDDCRL